MADQKDLTIPLPTNPSPKMIFLANAASRKNHNSLITSPVLKESIDAALAEYQLKLAKNTQESNGAAAAMFKIKGACEFIDEFYKLAEAYQRAQQTEKSAALDHSV